MSLLHHHGLEWTVSQASSSGTDHRPSTSTSTSVNGCPTPSRPLLIRLRSTTDRLRPHESRASGACLRPNHRWMWAGALAPVYVMQFGGEETCIAGISNLLCGKARSSVRLQALQHPRTLVLKRSLAGQQIIWEPGKVRLVWIRPASDRNIVLMWIRNSSDASRRSSPNSQNAQIVRSAWERTSFLAIALNLQIPCDRERFSARSPPLVAPPRAVATGRCGSCNPGRSQAGSEGPQWSALACELPRQCPILRAKNHVAK